MLRLRHENKPRPKVVSKVNTLPGRAVTAVFFPLTLTSAAHSLCSTNRSYHQWPVKDSWIRQSTHSGTWLWLKAGKTLFLRSFRKRFPSLSDCGGTFASSILADTFPKRADLVSHRPSLGRRLRSTCEVGSLPHIYCCSVFSGLRNCTACIRTTNKDEF